MLELKMTLDCTSKLESALTRLAEAVLTIANSNCTAVAPYTAPDAPAEVAVSAAQEPVERPTPKATDVDLVPVKAAPQTAAPTAEPVKPKFTAAQIGRAGAALIGKDSTNMLKLQALMNDYGIKAITGLPEDKLDEFAARMIEMGAEL